MSRRMIDSEIFIQKIKCQNYKVRDEIFAEHDKKIRADILADKYSQYGIACIDAYSDAYSELEEWIAKQLKEQRMRILTGDIIYCDNEAEAKDISEFLARKYSVESLVDYDGGEVYVLVTKGEETNYKPQEKG